jgi:hypothetical protein
VPKPITEDPDHWRARAEKARTQAEQFTDPDSRRTMLDIARGYYRMAERAEERRKGHKA